MTNSELRKVLGGLDNQLQILVEGHDAYEIALIMDEETSTIKYIDLRKEKTARTPLQDGQK